MGSGKGNETCYVKLNTPEAAVKFERLIFLKPKNPALSFSITTDKEAYQPGDQVSISLQLDNTSPTISTSSSPSEKFLASLTVTDISSFLSIPSHKLQPSLPSMVYLEKEVMQLNGEVDEFQYSNEYLDGFFDVSQELGGDGKFTDE